MSRRAGRRARAHGAGAQTAHRAPSPPALPLPRRSVAPSPAPAAPVSAANYPKATVWSATFAPTTNAGFPAETYSLKCVLAGEACTAEAQGEGEAEITRAGSMTGLVTGLTPSGKYSCYSIASNAGNNLCSAKADVNTLPA